MKTAKFESKKRAIWLSLLVVGLLVPLLNSPSATAADFIWNNVVCPNSNVTLLPAGGRIEISDIIVSASRDQTVTLKFTPGSRVIMRTFVKGFDTVVSNFTRPLESIDEEALKLDCSGTEDTKVTVTVVGSSTW
jgi:hypothetical protein